MNINCAKCGKENIIKQLSIMVYKEVVEQFPYLKEYQGKHICDECLHDICMPKAIDNITTKSQKGDIKIWIFKK